MTTKFEISSYSIFTTNYIKRTSDNKNYHHRNRSNLLYALTLDLVNTYKICNSDFRSMKILPQRTLTNPSIPINENSRDNDDGNLICRVHDIIQHDNTKRYIILDLLGTGTFGQVFRCQNMVTKDIIAIKIIRNKPAYYKQGLIEIKISKLFNNSHGNHSSISSSSIAKQGHQHIIKYLDSFIFLGHVCLVFELLSMSLLDVLSQNQFRGLPLSVVQRFCRQILMALVAMEEENVIHCDLKPENILLVPLNIHKQQQQQQQQLLQRQKQQQQQQPELKSREEVSAVNERIHHPNSVVITAASLKDDEIVETDGVDGGDDGGMDDSTNKRDDNSSNIDTTLDDSNSNTTQSNTINTPSTVLPTLQGQTTRRLGVGGGMSDVKVIDFGSACFEGKTVFSYIQSRFCKYYHHYHHHHHHD